MSSNSRPYSLALNLTVSLAGLAAPHMALAQSRDAARDNALEEIVVTAQFRETKIEETPLAISAITGNELASRCMTEVQSVAATAPSVTLVPGPASFGKTTVSYIRGVGANDFNPAFDPAVGFYVDDVYYASLAGTTFDLMDLERVEILRGPQGTLFGKNTIGGAIRLISKQPDSQLGGYVEGTYGSYDRIDVRGSINLPIAETVGLRVSGVHKQRDGYVKRIDFACAQPALAGTLTRRTTSSDCGIGREGGENIDAVRVALRAQPTDHLDIKLAGDYTDDRSEPGPLRLVATGPDAVLNGPGAPAFGIFPANTYQFLPAFGIPYDDRFIPSSRYRSYATYDNALTGERMDTTQRSWNRGLSGTVSFRFSDALELRSISGYRELRSRFVYDSDGSPLPLATQFNDVNYQQLSQELQLLGSAANQQIEWVIGAYYFDGDASYDAITDLIAAGLFAPSSDEFGIRDYSGFAHVTFHATDRLNFIAGARYTREKKDFHLYHPLSFYLPGGSGTVIPGPVLDYVAEPLEYSRWNPKFSVDYKLAPNAMIYAQYSTGFRGGGFNNRPFTAAQVFAVDPESLKAYELGLKSQFFDDALALNLTAFQSDYSKIQQVVAGVDTSGVPFTSPLNVGDARIRGLELESTLAVGGLQLSVVASYLDAKIKEARQPGGGLLVPPSALPQEDSRLAFSPKYRVNVGAEYAIALGGLGTLTPRVDVAYQSSIKYDSTGSALSVEPSYTVVNGRLTWDPRDDLSVALGVTNAFDKYYDAFIFNTYVQGLGSLTATPSRPREWSLTVRKSF